MATALHQPLPADIDDANARNARYVVIEALLLGVLADSALRTAPGGLGWTVWVGVLALAAVNVAQRRGLSVTWEQRAWLGTAVACAIAFAWRDAEELRVYNVFGSLVALGMFAMSASGKPAASVLSARVRDVISAGVYMVRDLAVGTPLLVVRDAEFLSLPAVRGGAWWTAVRALLITAPLFLVFTVLLSKADPVFASLFDLPAINPETVISHLFLTGFFAWLAAGWLRGALLGVSRRSRLPDHLPVRLGIVEVTTALASVIVLFAIFVALQLRWLFGGADVVLSTTGLTVAQYARQGFFELVMVSALVVPLILGSRAAIDDERVVRRHRQLSLTLMMLLAAIMTSAMLRMRLYIDYFGLTTDRLYATAFMTWLAIVLGAMAVTVLRGWTRPFAAMSMLSGFTMLFTLNAINPELVVARVNLNRAAAATEIDYTYFVRLSGDAAPLVVDALRTAPPSASACDAAKGLRLRWAHRQEALWNLGARQGRRSVMKDLSPTDVLRLCAGASASAGNVQ